MQLRVKVRERERESGKYQQDERLNGLKNTSSSSVITANGHHFDQSKNVSPDEEEKV